mgnify:CR=1 FL=1
MLNTLAMERRAVHRIANRAVYEHQAAASWRGVPMDKCATDLLAYQEIIYGLQPEIVIETGSWAGGSGLFLADMCYLFGMGKVISIDLNPPVPVPYHPLLTFIKGNSEYPEIVRRVRQMAGRLGAFVILDSAHDKEHVLAELDAYSPLIGAGGYLIVEDTNINGNPVLPDFGPGPREAVEEWLERSPEFEHAAEPYVSFCPSGYLRRVCV